jgi:phosphoribosylaminoimidazole (AIR) synthetase
MMRFDAPDVPRASHQLPAVLPLPRSEFHVSEAPSAYRRAGVDIDKKYAAVAGASAAIRSTFTKGVVGDVGLFGGLFDPAAAGAGGQLLVASTDGVGTKVMIARQRGTLGSVGEDLVNHCVDDILVQGARPLFFLDYIAMSPMQPPLVQQIIDGLAKACRENGCALIGGETAEMPGVYREGEVDVAGTIVGCVPREQLLDGSRVRVGDQLLGLRSSGLHTNGYSLARRVLLTDAGFQTRRPAGRARRHHGRRCAARGAPQLPAYVPAARTGWPPDRDGAHHGRWTARQRAARAAKGHGRAHRHEGHPEAADLRADRAAWQGGTGRSLPACSTWASAWSCSCVPSTANAVVTQLRELGEAAFPLGEVIAGEQQVETLLSGSPERRPRSTISGGDATRGDSEGDDTQPAPLRRHRSSPRPAGPDLRAAKW